LKRTVCPVAFSSSVMTDEAVLGAGQALVEGTVSPE